MTWQGPVYVITPGGTIGDPYRKLVSYNRSEVRVVSNENKLFALRYSSLVSRNWITQDGLRGFWPRCWRPRARASSICFWRSAKRAFCSGDDSS